MADWEPIIDPRLVAAYGVDLTTLQANRRGQMTAQQREALMKQRGALVLRRLRAPAITVVVLVALLLLTPNPFVNGLRLIFALTLIIQLVFVFRFHQRMNREINAGEAKMYAGRVVKRSFSAVRILYCEYGEFMNLPQREWDAFEHRGRYRIYCTPRSNIIIAAQPVHKDEPLPEAWGRRSDRA